MQAPATYAAPAIPMSPLLSPRPVSSGFSAADIEPTIVTSRPSRIHTVPRPITTSQCQRAHGKTVHPGRDVGGDPAGLDTHREVGTPATVRPAPPLTVMAGTLRRVSQTRIETSRVLSSPPAAVFSLLCDPQGHVAIDSSGMLQDAEGASVARSATHVRGAHGPRGPQRLPRARPLRRHRSPSATSSRTALISWDRARPDHARRSGTTTATGSSRTEETGGTLATSFYDWSDAHPDWRACGIFPVLHEGALLGHPRHPRPHGAPGLPNPGRLNQRRHTRVRRRWLRCEGRQARASRPRKRSREPWAHRLRGFEAQPRSASAPRSRGSPAWSCGPGSPR